MQIELGLELGLGIKSYEEVDKDKDKGTEIGREGENMRDIEKAKIEIYIGKKEAETGR